MNFCLCEWETKEIVSCADAADALMLLNQDQDMLADLSRAICLFSSVGSSLGNQSCHYRFALHPKRLFVSSDSSSLHDNVSQLIPWSRQLLSIFTQPIENFAHSSVRVALNLSVCWLIDQLINSD